jgi:stage III sporulation protein AH
VKNIFKKNQLIITALAIMIAVAGYLNYSGSKLDSATITASSDTVSATDISAEDIYAETGLEELQFAEGDISSLDQDAEDLDTADLGEDENPGEAVMASTVTGVGFASEAKLTREQVRSKNKEILLEVINNTNISDAQKQDVIDSMIELTDIAERESAAELLLQAKGFEDVVVSITDDQADVVVNMTEIDDAGRAQIEDIVKRKTGISGENIVITPVAAQEE